MSGRFRGYMPQKNEDQLYDKHQEHIDQSPLGKIQQQYWTTKQQVIKKLGKKEDEFVVLSDAELDAKLDLFEAIEQSSVDLLRVIELYQDQIINLSIEESEMSTFLKSQSTYDTKTKAGKMMAAVSKTQHFAAQHRNCLRLPLVRLYNEVETFRYRAIADTFLTIRKMENSRTEYRGALLWMKNVSTELDPDASRKLEKFRRVQAQVKNTKTKFDRLKIDVTQKIDMLSASRCNMFSHVLVNYQRTLILFWTKTAKTFSAVAEAFKGYDHYEFNIIKDLVEPSKRMAEKGCNVSKPQENQNLQETVSKINKEKLIDLDLETSKLEEKSVSDYKRNDDKQIRDTKSVEEVNELIDLMTLNEASSLNEQLKELEILELDKRSRGSIIDINDLKKTGSNKSENLTNKLSDFEAFVTSSISLSESNTTTNFVDFDDETQQTGLKTFKDIMSDAGDAFEREWESAFSNNLSNNFNNSKYPDVNTDEFTLFSQISQSSSDAQSLSSSSLIALNKTDINLFDSKAPKSIKISEKLNNLDAKQDISISNSNMKSLEAWYELFAELDPIKNPDAIGQQAGLEEERNC